MHYVYVLKSNKDGKLYTGCTKDLKKRKELHDKGAVRSTSNRGNFNLIFYEAFLNQKDAFQREKWLKTGWGRNHLNKILNNYLKI